MMMKPFKHIDVAQAKVMVESGNVTVVDIRDHAVYMQGHLPGAKSISDDTIDTFLKETDKQKPLLCYCYHGISSQSAANFFAHEGFVDVYSMDGGFEAWRKQSS